MDKKSPIQTTSTKCQYHEADSKPTWCSSVKWYLICLIKQTIIKVNPTKT